jgi:hypothetical protein
VEGTRDGERHHLLGTELLGHRAGSVHALDGPGDHHLAGCVEVGHPHVVVRSTAGDLDVVVVQAEHRGHGAGVVDAGVVHRVGPLAHEAHAVVEGERPARRQRGVLAEAVAGAEAGFETHPFDGVQHHQTGDERAQLGVARVLELLGVGVEQQAGDVAVGVSRRLFDQFPALVVGPRPTHAGAL